MTTKIDLLRDRLHELLTEFNFNFDWSDGGDRDIKEIEDNKSHVVDDMLLAIEDLDRQASEYDFRIRVVVDPKLDTMTEYGEITPEDNAKKSEVL